LDTYESTPSATWNNYFIQVGSTKYYKSQTCSKGYYCPEDSFYQIPCPAGTINDLTGQTSIAACLNIADAGQHPGYYADKPGSYWEIV